MFFPAALWLALEEPANSHAYEAFGYPDSGLNSIHACPGDRLRV